MCALRSDLKSKLCEHHVADILIELLWIAGAAPPALATTPAPPATAAI